jgi:metal-dependent amidase/aminoacylase/carboxypeptidase family protein
MTPAEKNQIIAAVDEQAESIWEISSAIFYEPEIAFKEFKACQLLTFALNKAGFSVETGIGNLETAFRATYGNKSSPVIAILAEYDALVGLGHACGHNLIAGHSWLVWPYLH